MRTLSASVMVSLAVALPVIGCVEAPDVQQLVSGDEEPVDALHLKTPGMSFPDFGFMVTPEEYAKDYSDQPVFRLKTDFPAELPEQLPEFLSIDFKASPLQYLKAAQLYAFEGNLPEFGGGEVAWDPFANNVRDWYHIPWLHTTSPTGYPPNGGTEGMRGFIKEAEVLSYQLAATQEDTYQVYAITLVNDFAGYTLGKMWRDPENPDPRTTDKRYGGGFEPGTVFAKLLFTDAPPQSDPANGIEDEVPFLQNPVEWMGYVTESWDSPQRVVKPMRLLQMDIMARDPRANADTGWVFGTFVYNGAENNPESKFLNLLPLGLMWGNDPENTTNRTTPYPPQPVSEIINENLEQTVVFDNAMLPPQHLGWNGRLNGPADLNTSACMACHIAAQYPALMALVPPMKLPADSEQPPPGVQEPPPNGGSENWMMWFQNLEAATAMDDRAYSTDMSFQIAIAFQNFYANKDRLMAGAWASEYELAPQTIHRGGPR